MYKATQSQIMADCIEFYDDWGTGDNIRLDVYYRMCDEILAEIKNCPALLETNKSRYDGALHMEPGTLHEDKELHILLFDIIYCSHVYNLFDGIIFVRPKSKEKQLIIEQKNKAKELKAAYMVAEKKVQLMEEAFQYFIGAIENAGAVKHKAFGICDVLSVDSRFIRLKIRKNGEEKKLGFAVVIANGIITIDAPDFREKKNKYQEVMMKANNLSQNLEYAARALEPYEEYLE